MGSVSTFCRWTARCVGTSRSFVIEKIQADNGTEFATQFHWHVLDKRHRAHLHQAPHPGPLPEVRQRARGAFGDQAPVFWLIQSV
ncbi:hypothetical protein GCM10010470_19820 [Saccharopolyspora taberi]|uniref:Integrase catalytic domain-containing protein n=1 Tax=Saccharopolyspora taberi TaxID=60895 RepID=A0ABN3V9T8_9PSEU